MANFNFGILEPPARSRVLPRAGGDGPGHPLLSSCPAPSRTPTAQSVCGSPPLAHTKRPRGASPGHTPPKAGNQPLCGGFSPYGVSRWCSERGRGGAGPEWWLCKGGEGMGWGSASSGSLTSGHSPKNHLPFSSSAGFSPSLGQGPVLGVLENRGAFQRSRHCIGWEKSFSSLLSLMIILESIKG